MQLDQGRKGFSFLREGPLDMRMDPESKLSAKEIVNKWPEKELGKVFRELGEERQWRKAAKAIVDFRRKQPIETTKELSDLLAHVLGFRSKKRLHPATLVFQALRICVNRELEALQEGLSKALCFLSPGGRMGVISYHSLEDRIVKNIFRAAAAPLKTAQGKVSSLFRILTKKPLGAENIRINPRARSAKMRFMEKMEHSQEA